MKQLFHTLCMAGTLLFAGVPAGSQVIFRETFNNISGPTAGGAGTYAFPAGWMLRNVDNRTPAANVSYINEAWERREDFKNSVADSCAFSTSWYNPAANAEDWMWTPPITLPATATHLKWRAQSYDPQFQDGYEVRIMAAPDIPTGGTGVYGNQVTKSTLLASIPAENSNWTTRSVSLERWAGQSIRIAFRNNSFDKFILVVDDITVVVTDITASLTAQTNLNCNGGSDGSLSITASGGTAPYAYVWFPSGGTGATAGGLPAGTYTCRITDANFQVKEVTTTITEPTAISASVSSTDVSCSGGTNGTASLIVAGGTPPYSYSWAPSGGTGATATGLAASTYTCTVTDNNRCTYTRTITINQPAALSATTSQLNASCFNPGVAAITVTGGTAPYTYVWAPSGGTGATANGLTPGNYIVTATDGNGCTITRSFTIYISTATITATATQTDVTCNGGSDGSASVSNVTGGTAPYTYVWAPSGGTGATATGLSANTYTCTITDANGCSLTKSVTVNAPAPVQVSTTAIPANGTYVIGSNLDFRVTFSEPVTVNGNPHLVLTLNTGGAVNALYYSGSGSNTLVFRYPIAATDQDPDGIHVGSSIMLNGGSIQSAALCNAALTLTGLPPTTGILVKNQVPQAITFNTISTKIYGDADFSPGATSNSGLTVSYTSSNTSVATITGTNIHIVGAGNTTITATQTGNGDYLSAPNVQQSLTVNPASITVTAVNKEKVFGQADPTLTYTLNTPLVPGDVLPGSLGRVSGENAGDYPIQQGSLTNNNYAITFVPAMFTIRKADQQITWNQTLAAGCDGNKTIVLTASSNSGLPVSYISGNLNAATISNNVLTIVHAGEAIITALQPGNGNYNEALAVTKELVAKLPSNLVVKHWNDVLFFDNSSKQYTAWQWYRNGTLVSHATGQYYYESGNLNGSYHVVAKTTAGTLLQTCPLAVSPGPRTMLLSVFPNPAAEAQTITIKMSFTVAQLQGATLTLTNMQGMVLQTLQNVSPQMTMQMPFVPGIYVVQLKLANGTTASTNVVVR